MKSDIFIQIISFLKTLLVPYSVLGADDTAVNKPAKLPALMDLTFQGQCTKISKQKYMLVSYRYP